VVQTVAFHTFLNIREGEKLFMKKSIYFGVMLMMTMCVSGVSAQDGTMKTDDKMQMSGKKNADSKFMMTAATAGMNEITLSNQALTKSTNEEVKQFAQTMIDEHTKVGDELKSLATTKNVTLPMEADAKHQAALTKMSSMTGSSFDMEYVKMMVKDHEKAVELFQKQSTKGKDEEAKAFAAKTLPALQGHLDSARALMTKMSGNKTDNTKTDSKMTGM
jgi:putative membrane protein